MKLKLEKNKKLDHGNTAERLEAQEKNGKCKSLSLTITKSKEKYDQQQKMVLT